MFSFFINNVDVFLNIISKHVKINLAFIFNEYNTPKQESYISIDVVIPLIAKDLLTVENCIAGLKKHSLNRIRNIYIISPNDDKIIFFAKQNKLVYLNEDLISGVSNNEIIEYLKNDKMIGWLKQQIIKLNIDNIPSIGKNVLLIDSDTILCKDQYFISDSYSILKFSDEFHIKYRLANYLLLKKFDFKPISFISHHQIINLEYLKELKSKVESNSKLKFNYAFLEAYKKIGMVSEYELYAQYVLTYHSEKYKTQYWFNDNLTINAKSIKLSKRAISYSLHNYNYK
jgi:hypothetical protein